MAVTYKLDTETKLPKITSKQIEIINLLYKYRFLTRIQIQQFLKHKDKKTIQLWLNDLRAKDYINWIYDGKDFYSKTKPAIYYLGLNSLRRYRYWGTEPETELRKRYREHERSQSYIEHCLLVADCCLELEQFEEERPGDSEHYDTLFNYFYEVEADYLSNGMFSWLKDSEYMHPDICFQKLKHEGTDEPESTANYLLEMFDATLPRYRLANRLRKYIEFFDEDIATWDEQTYDEPRPTILLVCARLTDLIYAKRKTRGLLANFWDYDEEGRPHVQFTTIDKLKEHGVLAKEIWEEA